MPAVAHCLFALLGCFPARFVFGLFFSVVSFEEWSSRTGRHHLDWVPSVIVGIGFAVGFWWYGGVAEGTGLFTLFFLFIGLTERPLAPKR